MNISTSLVEKYSSLECLFWLSLLIDVGNASLNFILYFLEANNEIAGGASVNFARRKVHNEVMLVQEISAENAIHRKILVSA